MTNEILNEGIRNYTDLLNAWCNLNKVTFTKRTVFMEIAKILDAADPEQKVIEVDCGKICGTDYLPGKENSDDMGFYASALSEICFVYDPDENQKPQKLFEKAEFYYGSIIFYKSYFFEW